VILYSAGYVPLSTIEHSKADEFVIKPFDIKQLLEKIKEIAGYTIGKVSNVQTHLPKILKQKIITVILFILRLHWHNFFH
jgi:hypothetical protein